MPSEGQPNESATLARFAAQAKARRKAAGLTQGQVAYLSGLDTTEVSRLERGLREPRLWTIVRLARGLRTEPADLMQHLR